MQGGEGARPSRILYLITELNVGGAERSLALLLAGLDRDRFAPIVVCLYGSDSPVADELRALGITVHDLGMSHKWRLDAFYRLFRVLRQASPVILHTLLFHANISGRVIGRLAGVPIVINGERTMGMERQWRYLLNRLTLQWVDRVICVSQQVADFCVRRIGVPRTKIAVIPNGVDPPKQSALLDQGAARRALGLPVDGVLVGTVARLDPVKRLDVLLGALAMLDDAHVFIVGYGPEERRLKAMANDLGLAPRVRFAGYQQDVWPWLAACDVFALSSDWEGMPNAVLEAMGAGLPVVATSAGGTPDVVVDGVTGLLVPTGDAAALAAALAQLVRDVELRRTMGEAGRLRARRYFSAQSMVERTQALYTELLGR